jgi:hypothetical protein
VRLKISSPEIENNGLIKFHHLKLGTRVRTSREEKYLKLDFSHSLLKTRVAVVMK